MDRPSNSLFSVLRLTGTLLPLWMCVACQAVIQSQEDEIADESAPPPSLPVEGSIHYRVLPDESEVRILVYRGGPLAEFGHNHVISATGMRGDIYLTPEFHDSGFLLNVPLRKLVVDPASARTDEGAGFDSRLSEEAIKSTKKNMLGPDLLDVDAHPEITVRSLHIAGPAWGPDITCRITLHGQSRDKTVPVAIARTGDRITVTGTLEIRLTNFGIKPFTILGGGLQVRDRIKVRFRLVAEQQ